MDHLRRKELRRMTAVATATAHAIKVRRIEFDYPEDSLPH